MPESSTPSWQDISDQIVRELASEPDSEWEFPPEPEDLSEEPEVINRHVPNIDLPVSDVKVYETVSITELFPDEEKHDDLSAPIDLLTVDVNKTPTNGPAIGVITRFEQAWRMKGLSLGRLLHSLSLAPGEVTQIAMVEWERGTRGSTTASTDELESAAASADRNRTTEEVTEAVAAEIQRGGSTTSTKANQTSAGVGGAAALFGFSGGASTNSSTGSVASWSTGSRNAAADSQQRIRERTAQKAAKHTLQQIHTGPGSVGE